VSRARWNPTRVTSDGGSKRALWVLWFVRAGLRAV